MTEVDFGKYKKKEEETESKSSTTSITTTTTTGKKPRITTEKLKKQFNQLTEKLKKQFNQLEKEIETLKEELPKKDLFKSQSIIVKRMCITVLKQYQNNLTSPLAQDVQELLSFLGYDPKQIIKEIKQTKRK
ncbi:MAG: hypothetical protein ACFFDN_00090 [Candidatus Hodarchaeota archaeon]